MSRTAWQPIASRIRDAAAAVGLDIAQPFNTSEVSELDVGRPGALGLLLGNTRALWPIFLSACRKQPTLATARNPLDRYVSEHLTRIVAEATPLPARLIFAHVVEPVAFPIQRLAEQIGLASLSPSHLAIHPLHGPWLSLRAVALIDVDGPSGERRSIERPCAGCSAPCVAALERALAVSGSPLDAAAIAAHSREWIAVRDACPVGVASRYSEAQLDYHYAPSAAKLVQGS